ncbi:MAG: diaminopimelate epimerase [Flavobacteriaceae bacterium]
MSVTFYKYEGAGNDFILFDNRQEDFHLSKETLAQLCDRRFGVGADGLMTINPSTSADFHLDYYNADGSIGSLCGNGSRCAVAFAHRLELMADKTQFTAADGLHQARLDVATNLVELSMHPVHEITDHGDYIFMDTGSPHHVQLVSALEQVDVPSLGKQLRHDVHGFSGANINFVEQKSPNAFAIRTYERGVEAETLACGTGAVAAAIAMHYSQQSASTTIEMHALGGVLKVQFNPAASAYTDILLTGPATFVFKGELPL